MKWCGVVLLVLSVCVSVWGGKWGKIGGRGGGGKKTPSQPKYPRQPSPPHFDSRPPPYNPSFGHDSRPPPYNPNYNSKPSAPGWNVQPNQGTGWNQQPPAPGWKQPPPAYNPEPPPPYSKNPSPYPQSGGHGNPPPYSQYPQSGHYPQSGSYPGYSGYPQGSYPGYGGYPQGGGYHLPQYPQSYGGGYNYKEKKKGWNMPGIIPLPIPIPIGGGGLGFGSFGGGFYRPKGNSLDKEEDEKERPRIIVPPDLELEGVTELPSDSPIAQWDVVGKEKAISASKKRHHRDTRKLTLTASRNSTDSKSLVKCTSINHRLMSIEHVRVITFKEDTEIGELFSENYETYKICYN